MKRSIILLVALTVALTLAVVPVSAGQPPTATGTWDYYLTAPPEVRTAGPNVFIYGQDHGDWTGTFTGYTDEDFVVICHPKRGFSFYKGDLTFHGTVRDASGVQHQGTMTLKTRGKQYSDTCDPSPALWNGHWVITGGTEGLANVHGQGTFDGPSLHLNYEGQVHFS